MDKFILLLWLVSAYAAFAWTVGFVVRESRAGEEIPLPFAVVLVLVGAALPPVAVLWYFASRGPDEEPEWRGRLFANFERGRRPRPGSWRTETRKRKGDKQC